MAEVFESPFMLRALELADTPLGCVLPNPRVGAVIVQSGRILGEGFHSGPGNPHAEVVAINDAESKGHRDFTKATLYISLEPCCHTKKRTPPCAPLVIEKKFARVVVAMKDPNPVVSGKGIKMIQEAGIPVDLGLCSTEAHRLNQAFIKNQTLSRPYITLKIATTFDGLLADDFGQSKWITSDLSRADVHRLRARCDAIAVGAKTFLIDDPQLNVRINENVIPKRVFIFGRLTKKKIAVSKAAQVNGLDNLSVISSQSSLPKTLKTLYEKNNVCHLLVEGGAQLASAFLNADQVDEIILYQGRGILGGKGKHRLFSKLGDRKLKQTLDIIPEDVQLMGRDIKIRTSLHVYGTC